LPCRSTPRCGAWRRHGRIIIAAALPARPDPIFAAIEAHRAAWAHLEENPSEDDAECDRRYEAVTDAGCVLIDTGPTTIAGAVALLRYVAAAERDGDRFDYADGDARITAADALEKLARAFAGVVPVAREAGASS
jgi:hypothetical protein